MRWYTNNSHGPCALAKIPKHNAQGEKRWLFLYCIKTKKAALVGWGGCEFLLWGAILAA